MFSEDFEQSSTTKEDWLLCWRNYAMFYNFCIRRIYCADLCHFLHEVATQFLLRASQHNKQFAYSEPFMLHWATKYLKWLELHEIIYDCTLYCELKNFFNPLLAVCTIQEFLVFFFYTSFHKYLFCIFPCEKGWFTYTSKTDVAHYSFSNSELYLRSVNLIVICPCIDPN